MYTKTDLKIFKQKYFLHLFLLITFIVLFLATLILSLCFTNYKNYLYFEIFGGILCAIFIFLSILFFFKTMDYRRIVNHYNGIFMEKITYFDGTLISLGTNVITLDDNIRVKELRFKRKDKELTYYLLFIFDVSELKIGNKYHVAVSDRFIRSFENEI